MRLLRLLLSLGMASQVNAAAKALADEKEVISSDARKHLPGHSGMASASSASAHSSR
jgi:hypothetical protein